MTVIHWSDLGDQPDVRIACDQTFARPAWGASRASATGVDGSGVYRRASDGLYYTFVAEVATCPACRTKAGLSSSG